MRPLALISACLLLALAGCASGDDVEPLAPAKESGRSHAFDVEQVASGLNRPTYVTAAPGDAGALWVLEQPGRLVRLRGDRRETVLDLSEQVKVGAEQGLLGLEFHPDFAANRRLFLHWSDLRGDTRVAEFRLGRDAPLRELLYVDQPEENHNGGQLAFGPDGRLYLGLGDGGGAFDPERRAQDPDDKLGKLLSADVREAKPEWRVELIGLRNPWRFSFEPSLGEIWIGDVGQDRQEEVDRVFLEPDEPPKNLGWSVYEGTRKVGGEERELGPGEVVWPVATYSHDEGCSITGGFVYHGAALPALQGRYLYGDFCSGALWTLKGTPEGRAGDLRREQAVIPQLTAIGRDDEGEPVFAAGDGKIYRAVTPGGRR